MLAVSAGLHVMLTNEHFIPISTKPEVEVGRGHNHSSVWRKDSGWRDGGLRSFLQAIGSRSRACEQTGVYDSWIWCLHQVLPSFVVALHSVKNVILVQSIS